MLLSPGALVNRGPSVYGQLKTGGPQKRAEILKSHSSANFQVISSIFAPNEAELSKL